MDAASRAGERLMGTSAQRLWGSSVSHHCWGGCVTPSKECVEKVSLRTNCSGRGRRPFTRGPADDNCEKSQSIIDRHTMMCPLNKWIQQCFNKHSQISSVCVTLTFTHCRNRKCLLPRSDVGFRWFRFLGALKFEIIILAE